MTIMSAAEEDTELRDLVAQTLEANGVLGKIRAQLRASVFLALEEQEKVESKTPLLNRELQKFLATTEGCQVASLVREFLQFFNLEYTLAVFEPELGCVPEKLQSSRSGLARQLNIAETPETSKLPLLSSLVRHGKAGEHEGGRRHSLTENSDDSLSGAKNGIGVAKSGNLPPATGKSKYLPQKDPGSDEDSDPFFDSPIKNTKPVDWKEDMKQASAGAKAGNNSMSSLAGLPSLTANGRGLTTGSDAQDDVKDRDRLLNLDYDDDKYEDDFQPSNISPVGQTPRSARSDKNVRSLENDEIDEEIEEDISGGDDLLGSDNDELTIDQPVPAAGQVSAADYIEDVLQTESKSK